MNKETIEYYHSIGALPDIYYYQLNGKTADENYREQHNKRFKLSKQKFTIETFIMSMLRKILQQTLNELLKDFNK